MWQIWGQNCILEAEPLILSAPPTTLLGFLDLPGSPPLPTHPHPTRLPKHNGLGPHPSHAAGQAVIGGPLVKPGTHTLLHLPVPQA